MILRRVTEHVKTQNWFAAGYVPLPPFPAAG